MIDKGKQQPEPPESIGSCISISNNSFSSIFITSYFTRAHCTCLYHDNTTNKAKKQYDEFVSTIFETLKKHFVNCTVLKRYNVFCSMFKTEPITRALNIYTRIKNMHLKKCLTSGVHIKIEYGFVIYRIKFYDGF